MTLNTSPALPPSELRRIRRGRGLTWTVAAVGKPRLRVERRLHLAPRLRQVLVRPRPGLGPPAWADDPRFDIRQHVRSRTVPPPGDEAALLAACSQLNQPPLDRSRPLRELWLLLIRRTWTLSHWSALLWM